MAANDFIKVDPTQSAATKASLLLAFINQLQQALETGTRVLTTMTHMEDGTTFTAIETFFGLPAGKGQTVFNMINGAVGAMNGTFQNNQCSTLYQQLG